MAIISTHHLLASFLAAIRRLLESGPCSGWSCAVAVLGRAEVETAAAAAAGGGWWWHT